MRIAYSSDAVGDLRRLREFIAVKNPRAAGRIAASLVKGIEQLRAFPYLGVEVAQAPDPEAIRDLIIGNYIARYLVDEEQVYILRIWHHKEDRP